MKRILAALALSAMTVTLVAQEQTPIPDTPPEAPPPGAPADTVPAPEPTPPPDVPSPDGTPAPAVAPPVVGTNGVPIGGTNAPAGGTNVVEGGVTNAAPEGVPAEGEPAEGEETPAPLGSTAIASEVIPLIQIEDVPLTDAIRNLARQANLNFQFDPRVTASNQPNVSIRFENVTASEALQAVLDNYDLQLVRDPRTRIARITIKDPKAEDPLVSKILQLRYSDPTNMVGMIKPNLSARSQVIADSRTSQLIVTTTEKEMTAVEELVARLDLPTKQVLIEAHIFETSRTPSTIKGID
jgi:type IV pilus assembly protein PilQ